MKSEKIDALFFDAKNKSVEVIKVEKFNTLPDLTKRLNVKHVEAVSLHGGTMYMYCDDSGWLNGTNHGIYINNAKTGQNLVVAGSAMVFGKADAQGYDCGIAPEQLLEFMMSFEYRFISGKALQYFNPVKQ